MSPDFPQDPQYSSSDPSANPGLNDLDTLKRDRFELLSAYLDSEVTAAERKQVEHWLATEPEIQGLYARLLKLHHQWQEMPVPAPAESVEQTIERVFARVDRGPRLRLLLGGVGAAAAVLVGVVTGLMSGDRGFLPQVAQTSKPASVASGNPSTEAIDPTTLMVALDRPPVEIPQAGLDQSNPDTRDGLDVDWRQDVR